MNSIFERTPSRPPTRYRDTCPRALIEDSPAVNPHIDRIAAPRDVFFYTAARGVPWCGVLLIPPHTPPPPGAPDIGGLFRLYDRQTVAPLGPDRMRGRRSDGSERYHTQR